MEYVPLTIPKVDKKKVKNPLDPGEKNPFVYDSSDSEDEQIDKINKVPHTTVSVEPKAVWKENLFFSKTDQRLKGKADYCSFFLLTNFFIL